MRLFLFLSLTQCASVSNGVLHSAAAAKQSKYFKIDTPLLLTIMEIFVLQFLEYKVKP